MPPKTLRQIEEELGEDDDDDNENGNAGADEDDGPDEEEAPPPQRKKKPTGRAPVLTPSPKPPILKPRPDVDTDSDDDDPRVELYEPPCGKCKCTGRDCEKAKGGGSCLSCKSKKYKCKYATGKKREHKEEEEMLKPKMKKTGKAAPRKAPEPES